MPVIHLRFIDFGFKIFKSCMSVIFNLYSWDLEKMKAVKGGKTKIW